MRAICLALMLLLACPAIAQKISGTVKDEQTRQPLEGVVIRAISGRTGAVSDSIGNFTLQCEDSLVILSLVGYRSDTVATARANGIILLQNNLNLGVVNVTGDRAATTISLLDAKNLQVMGKKELCKAACCNLSESFETNASVDGSFTDAISGTRQIKMLGLEGYYSQITLDNIPNVRGLSGVYGLGYVPGPWVDAIYLSKGVGSVTSGYESITGQINVATKNTSTAEPLHINAYTSNSGRQELNIIWNPMKPPPHDHQDDDHHHEHKVLTSLLAHGAYSGTRADMNGDGFMDNPLFKNVILQNDWSIELIDGLSALVTGRYLNNNHTSGQLDYSKDSTQSALWGAHHTTERIEAHAKVGYVFPTEAEKSIGSQFSYIQHDIVGRYGFRDYLGKQETFRGHLLYSTASVNGKHKAVSGATLVNDMYYEQLTADTKGPLLLNSFVLKRGERVVGAFSEYTFTPNEKLIVVAGARVDHHNLYGIFYTPRLHLRWNVTDRAAIKWVSGSGRRVANPIMDNVGLLGGNRNLWLAGDMSNGPNGLKMEEAWNNGLIWVQKGKMFHREHTLTIDAYHTRFVNQAVVDYETPGNVFVYNLQGKSYSNSVQVEWHFTPARRLDVRTAYRWLEARTQYGEVLKDRPLTNRHRAFVNMAYETKANERGRQFRFDCTVQWIGKKRRPAIRVDEAERYTPEFFQWMAQATYVIKKNFEIYLGGENLSNYKIKDAIIDYTNVVSSTMDASQTWGPVFGAMGYFGLRFIVE